nr:integrase, catalytic region, zinc finger, CCHC-type, peptidase aspartic, catalytic [Tanacetum cinerariifolium]
MCDVHVVNNHTPLEAKDHVEIVLNDDISSSDEDSLHEENIEYVEASPHDSELVSLEAAELLSRKLKRSRTIIFTRNFQELQSENKHLKSKVIVCKMCQNLQVQVEELKSVNESLNLSVKELYIARALTEATLIERDELVFPQCEKIKLLEEQSEPFYKEMGDKMKCFDEEKNTFETKIAELEKVLAQQIKDLDDETFTPQQELSAEQAFWLRISNPTIESSNKPPVRVEVPSELPKDVQIVLWYLDSGCLKHMTGNHSKLINFVSKFLGVDLLLRSQDINLYIIFLDDMLKTSPIYVRSKASKTKSWLWHHQLSHLNFDTLNKLAKDGLARGIPRL